MNDEEMNFLYNSVDVYINIASNEGFGLGSLEALTVGTPIVVNVTGGLQDQCGFKKDGKYLTADDYIELGSNHRGEYKEHGEWVKPVWPSNISLCGSPATPYIFDDRASYEDAGGALLEWYNEGSEERERKGEVGRQWVLSDEAKMTAEHLSQSFIDSMDGAFDNWMSREQYTLEVV
jgi:glycosyltransferase involved in cell wall biosynthesis